MIHNLYRKDHGGEQVIYVRLNGGYIKKLKKIMIFVYSKTNKYYFHAEDLSIIISLFRNVSQLIKLEYMILLHMYLIIHHQIENVVLNEKNKLVYELEQEIRNQNHMIHIQPLDTLITCNIVRRRSSNIRIRKSIVFNSSNIRYRNTKITQFQYLI
jgi:hypothetical protein